MNRTYMGYPVIKRVMETITVPSGSYKYAVDLVDYHGDIKRVLIGSSHAVKRVKFESDEEYFKRGTRQYRELKKVYPDLTPHHADGYYDLLPMDFHAAVRHTGSVWFAKKYMGLN